MSNTVDGPGTQLKAGSSGNCGITLVYGLPRDPEATLYGSYPVSMLLPFDLACVACKWGVQISDSYTGKFTTLSGEPLRAHLASKIGKSNSVYMWTDVDGNGNGLKCRDWMLKKGYTVDTIDVGPNINYPGDANAGYHFIRVFLWYDWDSTKKIHPKSTIREVRFEEEQQPKPVVLAPSPSLEAGPLPIRTDVRVPRRVDGEGVRTTGPTRSPFSIRRLARRKGPKL